MRRVVRHLFAIVAAMSLLLCVVTCALWARSYRVCELVRCTWRGYEFESWMVSGRLMMECTNQVNPWRVPHVGPEFHFARETDAAGPSARNTWWWRDGIDLFAGPSDHPGVGIWDRTLAVPLWVVATALGGGPIGALGLKWMKAKRRRGDGLCAACGYDLRASPERCPECGAAVGTKG